MTTTDTLSLPTPRTSSDLRLRDVRTPPQEPGGAHYHRAEIYRGKPMKRPSRTRLVATWSADARPTATWSVGPT